MKPTLRRRFTKWICEVVVGHKRESSHIHGGKRHYTCKRCGEMIKEPLSCQEMLMLVVAEKRKEEEEKMK